MRAPTSLDDYRIAAAGRRQTLRGMSARATFYFDLASPYTYLAAERAERMFTGLEWVPAHSDGLLCDAVGSHERTAIAQRAQLLGLPLVWPAELPVRVPAAMRVASLAVERGRSAAFVLAASRLVFCGSFDIEDPEILADAAAAADIDLTEMVQAAGDIARDGPIEDAARALLAAGADGLPAVRVGTTLFCGEQRLSQAACAARASA